MSKLAWLSAVDRNTYIGTQTGTDYWVPSRLYVIAEKIRNMELSEVRIQKANRGHEEK